MALRRVNLPGACCGLGALPGVLSVHALSNLIVELNELSQTM